MSMRKLFGLGVAGLAAQALRDNVTGRQGDGINRQNSFNSPASLQKPAREGQRNIPTPWIKRKWSPDIPIATIPSVIGVISGPTRTVLAQRGFQVPPGRILPGGPIMQNLARMLRGQAQPAQAEQPYGGASISIDDDNQVLTRYFRHGQVVKIGPTDTETFAVDSASVAEARARAERRPELERFFQEGVFGVLGEIRRRMGIGR